jgi:hypothetical protein
MYLIVFACNGVPPHLGHEAATDITEEFTHRPWHQNVRCEWDGKTLILDGENDWDNDGQALLDEFSDATAACISELFAGSITVRSITVLSDSGH